MLFLSGISFVYVVLFIVVANAARLNSDKTLFRNLVLLCGSFLILSLIISLQSILIISGICIATYFAGVYLSKESAEKQFLSLCLFIIIGLFIVRNYQLAGVELIQRVGLSYILFRLIHFLVDSYEKKIKSHDLLAFLNYVLFFPTFLAGPIDRYNNFRYWVGQPRQPYSIELIKAGIFRIALGLAKKFYLVPIIYSYAIDFSEFSNAFPWQAALMISLVVYSFYILFDFSGYSDIAIGTAYLIGIKTPENFNWPYLASNISMFWKRWHMTFSMFLFQYVFKPLVVSLSRTYHRAPRLFITCLGYLITFVICGMWHGNTLNFIYWGLWHAAGLMVFKLWSTYAGPTVKNKVANKLPSLSNAISVILTFIFVTVGWFFFNYSSDDIKAISQSFASTNEDALSVQAVRPGRVGFKVLFNDVQADDSLVQIRFKPTTSKTFLMIDQIISPDNAYFIVPENQSEALYTFRVRSVGKNNVAGKWHHQIQYLNHPVVQSPLQAFLFPPGVQWVGIPESRISTEYTLELPAGFRQQNVKARPHFFAGYGWSLVLEYMPSPIYRVEIRYKHEQSDTWVTYESQRSGKYSYAHLHGNVPYGGVNRNLLPGNYDIMIRYLYKGKKGPWLITHTTIADYVDEQGN